MIEYYGKKIPTELKEMVEPDKTALIIVDVQNDFCKKDGKVLCQKMLKDLKKVIDAARKAGTLIIWIKDTLLPNRFSDSAPWIRHYLAGSDIIDPHKLKEHVIKDSKGQEIVDFLKPRKDEVIIEKYRSSSFVGTPLDLLLRSNGIQNTIITGVVTHGCVESTARDASNDYFVVIPEDCVWAGDIELHDACLKIMKKRYDVTSSKDIIKIWDTK
jgi:nicotinamidase-related amidase